MTEAKPIKTGKSVPDRGRWENGGFMEFKENSPAEKL